MGGNIYGAVLTLPSRLFKFCVDVPHTKSAWGIAIRFWGSVIAVAVVVCFHYFTISDFLSNFIWFFRQFYFHFVSVFLILIELYVQVFYYYCAFVHYFPTSTSALVCIRILFCCIRSSIYCQLSLGVWLDRDELLICSWLSTFQASTIIGHWICGCLLFISLFDFTLARINFI